MKAVIITYDKKLPFSLELKAETTDEKETLAWLDEILKDRKPNPTLRMVYAGKKYGNECLDISFQCK